MRDWMNGLEGADASRCQAALDVMGSAWLGSLGVFDGVIAALAQLRERGYRMGLVSNCMVPPPLWIGPGQE